MNAPRLPSSWQWLGSQAARLDGLAGLDIEGLTGRVGLAPQAMKSLRIADCGALEALDLRAVTGLECVDIVGCPRLERLFLPADGNGIALTVRLGNEAARMEVIGQVVQVRVCRGDHDFRRRAGGDRHRSAACFDGLWLVPHPHPDDPSSHCAVLLSNGQPIRHRDRGNPARWELVLFGFEGASVHLQRLELPVQAWLSTDRFAWYAVSLVDCPGLRQVTCSARYLNVLRAGRGPLWINGSCEHVRLVDSLTTHIHLDLERPTRLHLKTLPILRGFSTREDVHIRLRGKVGDLVAALEELATTPGRFHRLVMQGDAETGFAAELLLRRAATVGVREDLGDPDVRRALLRLAADPRDRQAVWWLVLVLMGQPDPRGRQIPLGRERSTPVSLAFERGQHRAARGGFGTALLLQLYRLGPDDVIAQRFIDWLRRGRRLPTLIAVAEGLLALRRAGLDDPPMVELLNQLVNTTSVPIIDASIRGTRFGLGRHYREELEQKLSALVLVDPVACGELAGRVLTHDAPHLALPLGLAMAEQGHDGYRALLARALQAQLDLASADRRRLFALLFGDKQPAERERTSLETTS